MKHNRQKNMGFSLVELIVVIAIMAALVAILAPQYIKYVEKSRTTVCEANLVSAVQAYNIERIEGAAPQQSLLEQVVTDMSGGKDANGKYTGLCPTGGLVTAAFSADGSVKLTCSNHWRNVAPDFNTSLISTVINGNIFRTDNGKKQTLSEYLFDASKVVDSEAPDKSGSTTSFTKLIKDAMGDSISSDQSWRLSMENGQYVIYITTGGKLTSASSGKKVEATKYTFDTSGNQLGDGQSVSVTVGKNNSYLILKP